MSTPSADAARASSGYWDYDSDWYGSGLRDMAALITLEVEAKMPSSDLAGLLDKLSAQQAVRSWLSTQEEAWILRAAYATAHDQAHMKLALSNGAAADQDKPYLVRAGLGDLDKDLTVTNQGDQPVYLRATAAGVPAQAQPAMEAGASVSRQLYTIDGKQTSLDKIKQNDIVVAVVSGDFKDNATHRAMVIDLLPAGLEIENERLNNTRRQGDFAWLPEMTEAKYVEYRDDRYIAAFDAVPDNGGSFTFAYILRAVTPGRYKVPAAEVEDMYKPEIRARGESGQVVIAPYQ